MSFEAQLVTKGREKRQMKYGGRGIGVGSGRVLCNFSSGKSGTDLWVAKRQPSKASPPYRPEPFHGVIA